MCIHPSKLCGTSVPKYVTHRRAFLERQHVDMSAVEFNGVYHLWVVMSLRANRSPLKTQMVEIIKMQYVILYTWLYQLAWVW